MDLSYQLVDFVIYIIIGNVLCLILDIFRGYRKFKNVSKNILVLQDVIYFFLASITIIFANIFILENNFRVYCILGFILGATIYLCVFSKTVIKYIVKLFYVSNKIIGFIMFPFDVIKQVFIQICTFFYKIRQKTCKHTENMLKYFISRVKIRGFKYEKETKEGRK